MTVNNAMYNYEIEYQMSFTDLKRGVQRTVEQIDKAVAKQIVERVHYSRSLPNNTTHCFGLYENNELIGVVTYGIPASYHLCIGVAGKKNQHNVLELNRLVIMPNFNGNNRASFLVSHSLKMLPNYTFVVSYADTGWTHIGYVYQACNFIYTGLSVKRLDSYSGGKHPRCYDKTEEHTLWQTRNQKHRYIYLVGNKRERKNMRRELIYKEVVPYPKGDEQRYDVDSPKISNPIKIVDKDGNEVIMEE